MDLLFPFVTLISLITTSVFFYSRVISPVEGQSMEFDSLLKKCNSADINQFRKLVFFSALLFSLIFTWQVIGYKIPYSSLDVDANFLVTSGDEPLLVVSTKILEHEPPRPKPQVESMLLPLEKELSIDEVKLEVKPDVTPANLAPIVSADDDDDDGSDYDLTGDVPDIELIDLPFDLITLETQPEFPGGEDELMNFLQSRYVMPMRLAKNGDSGTIYVSFIIEKDGSVSKVETIRGMSDVANEEAERVVRAMPRWKPGKMAGQSVRVLFMVPFIIVGD